MFRPDIRQTPARSGFAMLELIFHAAVRNIRKSHGNAVVGLLMSILQSVIMVVIMVFMFDLMGGRGRGVRGDFVLYIMSGVFNYATHSKTLNAVAKSDGPTSAMMKHSPMNTIVAIGSAALGALYLQTLSACAVSYTHLDVYKRQVLSCATWPSETSRSEMRVYKSCGVSHITAKLPVDPLL